MIAAVIISFVGGFLLANALNRSELSQLRAENEKLKSAPAGTKNELTDEEIRSRIVEADANPQNTEFQKNLGIALYGYSRIKRDVRYLPDVERLLTRVYSVDPKDYDVLVTLGHAHFDIGYAEKSNERFQQARDIYDQALKQKPDDREIRIDYGLSYLFENPSRSEKTIDYLTKVLNEDPKHERALQFLARAYLQQNDRGEAEKAVARLREVNPDNPDLAKFEAELKEKQ